MSIFAEQLSAGLAAVRGLAGDPVVYHAGDVAIPIVAMEGTTKFETISDAGTSVTAIATDFMFAVAELVDAGQPVQPTPGHWIEKNGQRYELMPLGEERCYRYSDPGHTQYRVHTKQSAAV